MRTKLRISLNQEFLNGSSPIPHEIEIGDVAEIGSGTMGHPLVIYLIDGRSLRTDKPIKVIQEQGL